MTGFFAAFIVALAVAHNVSTSSTPDVSVEFVGDARLAIESVAKDAGKQFIDETNTAHRVLLRFDASDASIQSLENRLRFIAGQLPSDWSVVVRDREIVLRGGRQ